MSNAFLNALFLGLITLVLALIAVWAFNAINRKRGSVQGEVRQVPELEREAGDA